jgi:UDP-glucose 4-epimerase
MHSMQHVIAVPHNIYGPGQRYWDPFRNVAGIMINRVLQGKPPVIYGDGTQRRCLSHISDVTGPLLKLATLPPYVVDGQVFNVGPGDEGTTIKELAASVLEVTGSSLEPVHFPPRPGEVHEAWCSDAKAREKLGYEPQVGLKEGLARYVQWVEEWGPRPFDYHLPIEIPSPLAPETWTRRLM